MTDETRVLYNKDCPVCRFEIHHYRDYADRTDLAIRFEDLNTTQMDQWGLTRDDAAKRLYVQKGDQLLSGIPAFLVLWAEMPRYRWLGRLIGLPGLSQIAVFGYDRILAPIIYRWHLRRLRRAARVANASDPTN